MAWNFSGVAPAIKAIKDSSRAMESISIITFCAMFGTLITSLYLAHWFDTYHQLLLIISNWLSFACTISNQLINIVLIRKHMSRFTLSPRCISASSCSSSTHSNLDVALPIHITTPENLISKSHYNLQSNYYNYHYQSNGQYMPHKKRLMSVYTSPANECRSGI